MLILGRIAEKTNAAYREGNRRAWLTAASNRGNTQGGVLQHIFTFRFTSAAVSSMKIAESGDDGQTIDRTRGERNVQGRLREGRSTGAAVLHKTRHKTHKQPRIV